MHSREDSTLRLYDAFWKDSDQPSAVNRAHVPFPK